MSVIDLSWLIHSSTNDLEGYRRVCRLNDYASHRSIGILRRETLLVSDGENFVGKFSSKSKRGSIWIRVRC